MASCFGYLLYTRNTITSTIIPQLGSLIMLRHQLDKQLSTPLPLHTYLALFKAWDIVPFFAKTVNRETNAAISSSLSYPKEYKGMDNVIVVQYSSMLYVIRACAAIGHKIPTICACVNSSRQGAMDFSPHLFQEEKLCQFAADKLQLHILVRDKQRQSIHVKVSKLKPLLIVN